MDRSSPVPQGGLSSRPGRSLSSSMLTFLQDIAIYSRNVNLATASHHFAYLHACSSDLPSPCPTHGHRCKCAAFCGIHPPHTQLGSSVFPTSFSHCHCGPLSVTMYANPLTMTSLQLYGDPITHFNYTRMFVVQLKYY